MNNAEPSSERPVSVVQRISGAASGKELLEFALDASGVALWYTDLSTGQVFLSRAWARMLGMPEGETLTTLPELMNLAHPEDLDEAKRLSLETMKGERASYECEHRVRTHSGEWKWILSRGMVLERAADGRAVAMAGSNVDIDVRKRAEEVLREVAGQDPLTKVANRRLVDDRLAHAVELGQRKGWTLALLYLDIDRFKLINDKHGHAAGDQILIEFTRRIGKCVRRSDTVGRIGGDEFVVIMEDVKHSQTAIDAADRILDAVRQPVSLNEGAIAISTSVGIALWAEGESKDSLFARADRALYEAKRAGRNRRHLAS